MNLTAALRREYVPINLLLELLVSDGGRDPRDDALGQLTNLPIPEVDPNIETILHPTLTKIGNTWGAMRVDFFPGARGRSVPTKTRTFPATA